MKTYFVTGATGAIGSALIPVLLRDPETRVILLLRANSDADLAARVDGLFAFWQLPRSERVSAVRGDVALPRFALPDADYASLSSACTHIVHSAGNVRMNLPLEQARRSSVDSTRNVVDLARACGRLEKVEFVSTVGVGGRMRGVVPEQWITTPRTFHNTYEQAKAEAEDAIREGCERGLPLTVHRPSMVVGDSSSGRIIHFQIFYYLCEFLSGRRSLGLAPDFAACRLDIVPADYVAQVIAWSSTNSDTSGRILHSCSGATAVPLSSLRDRVRLVFGRAGRRLPPIVQLPTPLFSALLKLAGIFMGPEARRALRTLPLFLDYLASEQGFANERTLALLGEAGMALPPPEAYLDRVLGYYLANARQS